MQDDPNPRNQPLASVHRQEAFPPWLIVGIGFLGMIGLMILVFL